MSWYWIVWLAVIGGLFYALFFTETGRLAKSLYLVLRVSPYEQVGTGAGRILVVGDSTGYGTGATRASESVAGRMGAEFPGYQIENRSVNNDSLADAYKRVEDIEGRYDVVLLQIGANDIIQQREITETRARVLELYERLRPHAGHIVMVSAGNVGAAFAFAGTRAAELTELSRSYHSMVSELAAERDDFTYISLFDEPEDDVFVAEPDVYLSIDALHPSSAGYGFWYQKIAPALRTHLANN